MHGWHTGSEDLIIDRMLERREYDRALDLLREELEERPQDKWLRRKMADVLALSGNEGEAAFILAGVVDEYAAEGSVARGIAALKRLEGLGPSGARPPKEGKDIADALAATPLFSDLAHDELLVFIQGLRLTTYLPGQILLTEGEHGDSLFILAEGTVRVYVRDRAGRNEEVRTMSGGEFFGEIALLYGGMRTATVIAATRTEVLELGSSELEAIAARHPRIREILLRSFRERLEDPGAPLHTE